MISPEVRQSFLLSSSTVFMDSIHKASTGPSKMTCEMPAAPRAHKALCWSLIRRCRIDHRSIPDRPRLYCETTLGRPRLDFASHPRIAPGWIADSPRADHGATEGRAWIDLPDPTEAGCLGRRPTNFGRDKLRFGQPGPTLVDIA